MDVAYSILVDRIIDLHRTYETAALLAQAMGRRLVEQPPSLEDRLEKLAWAVGMKVDPSKRDLSDDEVALRRALGLRGS